MTGKSEELVNKVISMRFENNTFEKAASETIKTLGLLGDACKALDGATTGLVYLGKAASGLTSLSFSGASTSIHTVVDGFSRMGTIGDTVLRNLTNRVTDFVMTSISQFGSFTSSLLGMESVMGGFSEYEDKLGSIQTIKTNTQDKGTTLEDITKTLDELNHYADQTIYSFKEMTRNIGTFTAAGVSLEDSAAAIKGISNLAAGVGSTPQQAANAMYQLSQALASGTVNLQDWNSVVNAGMGGQYFQNALKETARELAKAKGVAFKEFEGTFRESISGNAKGDPWLTSEVLLETLKKFADDPSLMEAATRVKSWTQLIDTMKESVGSGWTETWEYAVGNLDEAADFFTMISKGFDKIVGSSAEARNEMMKFWHDNGGRDQIIKALVTGFQNLSTALKPIKRAFNAAFPPLGKERLLGMTEGLLNFVTGLKLTEPQLESLRNTSDRVFGALKGLLSAIKFWNDNGGRSQVIKALAISFQNLYTATKPIRRAFLAAFPPIGKERVLGLTESLLNFAAALKLTDPQLEFLRNTSDRVFGALKVLLTAFKGLGKVAVIVGAKQIPDAFNFLIGVASKAETAFHDFVSLLEHFFGIEFHPSTMDDFEAFGNLINDTLDAVKQKFTDGKTAVSEFYASFADGKVKAFVDGLTASVTEFSRNLTIEDLKNGFSNAIGSVESFFE